MRLSIILPAFYHFPESGLPAIEVVTFDVAPAKDGFTSACKFMLDRKTVPQYQMQWHLGKIRPIML